jgi:hypothetical protein
MQMVLILLVGGSVNNSMTVIISMKNAQLEQIVEMCTFVFFLNTACYDWTESMQSRAPSTLLIIHLSQPQK